MAQQHWTIDKRVPLAVILAMLVQIGVAVFWVAGLDNRISVLENGKYEERLQNVEKSLPVIFEKINTIDKTTGRIEKKLDKLSALWPQKHTSAWQENQLLLTELKSLGEIQLS